LRKYRKIKNDEMKNSDISTVHHSYLNVFAVTKRLFGLLRLR
jgi:hypothetical protein